MEDIKLVSRDGQLVFRILSEDGDVTLGFEGFESHTHGDILAALANEPQAVAIRKYIDALLSNDATIALLWKNSKMQDIWITDDPAGDLEYMQADEHIEFRRWDEEAHRSAKALSLVSDGFIGPQP